MKYAVFAIIVASLILTACNASEAIQPSITPSPFPTLEPPTATSSPVPSSTATQEATSTPTVDANQVARLAVSDNFTISVPFPLLYQVNGNIVLIGNNEKTLTMSFVSDTYDGIGSFAGIVDSYLGALEKRGWQFTKGSTANIQIDNSAGLIVDLTATFNNMSFEGQAVTAATHSDLLLFGLGLSKTGTEPDNWSNKYQTVFAGMLDTIKFTDTSAECPVATDKTYGYKEDNPIKVGGGDFTGPSRERAYLDHLRGPNKEQLSYERQGSKDSNNIILDIYKIKGAGVDIILYVDEYNYTEPQAPVGFTCSGAFPLSAP